MRERNLRYCGWRDESQKVSSERKEGDLRIGENGVSDRGCLALSPVTKTAVRY